MVKRGMVLGGLLVLVAGAVPPPGPREREEAAGPLGRLELTLRRAFSDRGEFRPKTPPGPSDWLASHPEKGQGYLEFINGDPNLPGKGRTKLYILPLGGFEAGKAPDLAALREYTAAYFHPLEVELLPAVEAGEIRAGSRPGPGGGPRQWKSRDLLAWLRGRLPADAHAMLAVTMTDLYPEEGWNFVFGQASLRDRVGVFSFARYHPSFAGRDEEGDTGHLVLRRSARVLTHEMGHMFGIRHCIHYQCNMNGANHLGEADATPMNLCPVCLRKLHRAAGFDPATRYDRLRAFYAKNGFDEEEAWVTRRAEAIRAAR